jgi:hypothetical protein
VGATAFADRLPADSGRSEFGARDEFLDLARRVIVADGAPPLALWAARTPCNIPMPSS